MQIGQKVRYYPRLMADSDLPTDGVIIKTERAGPFFIMDMLVIDSLEHWIPANECGILDGTECNINDVPCLLRTPIENLGFCKHTLKLLSEIGIKVLLDLKNKERNDLLGTKGFGDITMHEIRHELLRCNMHLKGDTFPEENEGIIKYYRPRKKKSV